ncbi:MAG: right-handed parallel beta-helix repeat-containing protein [Phycisphaerales bacterium]
MTTPDSSDRRMLIGSVAGVAGIAALAAMSKAGPLNPPAGAVASTGKTLTGVEPRIDLNASVGSSGVTTNGTWEFIISQPGSYYLSASIATAKSGAILINAADVTLDLNGFRVTRASSSGGTGISIGAGCDGAAVFNGSISGFSTSGIGYDASTPPRGCVVRAVRVRNCGNGIDVAEAAIVESCTAVNCGIGIITRKGSAIARCTVENATSAAIGGDIACTLVACSVIGGGSGVSSGAAISTSYACVLESCTVSGFNGGSGITTGRGSVLSNCSVIQNIVTFGINIGECSTATNCVASANTALGVPTFAGGIITASNCVLERCTASQNTGTLTSNGIYCDTGCTVVGCTANGNGGQGIQVAAGNVSDCTASGNHYDGLHGTDRSSFTNCVARGNGSSGVYANYVATIRGCVLAFNNGGILVDGGGGGEIAGNQCEENGNNSTLLGFGIRAQGPFVRIKDNHCYANWRNIEVVNTVGVVVTGNHCGAPGSGNNFNIVSGNKVGVIVSCPASGAITGNTGGTGLGSTDPTANFSY